MSSPTPTSHDPQKPADEGIESPLRYRDQFLLPGLNVADAAKIFQRAESEELAVLDNLGNRPSSALTEAHLLRRYPKSSTRASKGPHRLRPLQAQPVQMFQSLSAPRPEEPGMAAFGVLADRLAVETNLVVARRQLHPRIVGAAAPIGLVGSQSPRAPRRHRHRCHRPARDRAGSAYPPATSDPQFAIPSRVGRVMLSVTWSVNWQAVVFQLSCSKCEVRRGLGIPTRCLALVVRGGAPASSSPLIVMPSPSLLDRES